MAREADDIIRRRSRQPRIGAAPSVPPRRFRELLYNLDDEKVYVQADEDADGEPDEFTFPAETGGHVISDGVDVFPAQPVLAFPGATVEDYPDPGVTVVTIPSSGVQTVNGVEPDEDGNVELGEIGGAVALVSRRTTVMAGDNSVSRFNSNSQSNGTHVAENGRKRFKVTRSGEALIVDFDNIRDLGQVDAANAIQVSAAVVKGGVYYGVVFPSGDYARIPINKSASGVANVPVVEGEHVAVTWFVEPRDANGDLIASGRWPGMGYQLKAARGEYAERVNSGATNKTLTGGPTPTDTNSAFGPSGIRTADAPQTKLVPVFGGDSNLDGESPILGGDYQGLPGMVCRDSPYLNVAAYGEAVNAVVSSPAVFAERLALIKRYGDAYFEDYGSNDLNSGRTAAQLKADLVSHWFTVKATGVLIGTITTAPRTTSSDGFTSLAGQTLPAWEAARVDVNDWRRDGAPIDATTKNPVATGTTSNVLRVGDTGHPVSVVIDWCQVLESSINSGKWFIPASPLPLYTTDGSHLLDHPIYRLIPMFRAALGLKRSYARDALPPTALIATSAPALAQKALAPSMFLRLNENGEVPATHAFDQMGKHGGDVLVPTGGTVTRGVAGPGTDADKGISLSGGAFIELLDHPDFWRTSDFSMIAWLDVASIATAHVLFRRSGPDGFTWRMQNGNGFMNLIVNGGTVSDNAGGGVVSTNTKTRIGFSYAANGDVRFYKQGAATASTNNRAPYSGRCTPQTVTIGTDGTNFLSGFFKDLLYFPRVLTPTEFANDYAAR